MERSEITKTLAILTGVTGLAVTTAGCDTPLGDANSQNQRSFVISRQPSNMPPLTRVVNLPIIAEKPIPDQKSYRIDAVGASLEIKYRKSNRSFGESSKKNIKEMKACFDQRNVENEILSLEREVYGLNFGVSSLTKSYGVDEFNRNIVFQTPFGARNFFTRDNGQNSRNCYKLEFDSNGYTPTFTDANGLIWNLINSPEPKNK